MIDQLATITSSKLLVQDVYELKCKLNQKVSFQPGQFVEIKLHDFYLRRPISIADVNEDEITLLYKVVGEGTKKMATLKQGDSLQVLGPCGNGFDLEKLEENIVLVGGGIGIPPLYYLAKCLLKQNKNIRVILGFNTKQEIFYQKEFEELGIPVDITTVDGSYGTKGFVTSLIQQEDVVATCGPIPMLQAIHGLVEKGQYSLEARMGCGFGACMGCSIQTRSGNKRVCKEGPVFLQEDLLW